MEKLVIKYRKAKGFTLVELLVVIIIIGILAGMMMLSTGAATDKAEAAKIISDMRNIKSACLMYYADKNKWPDLTDVARTDVEKFLDQKMDNYKLVSSDTSGAVVGALFVTTSPDVSANKKLTAGVRKKLAAVAADSGLYDGATTDTAKPYAGGTTNAPCMVIKKDK